MFLKCFFLNLQVNVFNIYAIDTKYLGGHTTIVIVHNIDYNNKNIYNAHIVMKSWIGSAGSNEVAGQTNVNC